MLSPQWLKSFAAVVRLGSFTRAAEQLDLTQAAVSQHLRQLETQLGKLLVRKPRGVELTPAGTALLDYCLELEQADKRLGVRLSDANATRGEVSLVTPGSVGLLLYPMLLALQDAQRELVIRHRFAPDAEVIEAVLGNRYELGIATLKPDDARLSATPFAEEPLELVVPATAPARPRWDDLVALGFIDHPDGHAMATRLLSRHYPGSPNVGTLPCHGFSNQIALILEPVARGLGFTVIPRYARQAFARQEAIRVVASGVQILDTLWLLHRAEWPLSARAARVVAFLKQQVDQGDLLGASRR
jgi:DNA-binding transcriptional LysR family regulator